MHIWTYPRRKSYFSSQGAFSYQQGSESSFSGADLHFRGSYVARVVAVEVGSFFLTDKKSISGGT